MRRFPTYPTARRETAVPHKPLVDPADWSVAEMSDPDRWTYQLSAGEVGEIMDAVAATTASDLPMTAVNPETFPLAELRRGMRDVQQELREGRGLVRIRGMPVDELGYEGTMTAYLGLSSYLGSLEPQNRYGQILAHVKNFEDPRTRPMNRGYNTNLGSSMHVDSTDYVGLLCWGEPKSGGNSRIASSAAIYNRILAERPDLIDVLLGPFYKTRYGEERAGEAPYYKFPVFAFVDGYFSCYGVSKKFLKDDNIPGVPPYTDKHREAVEVFVAAADECSVDMPFQRGDVQYCHNNVVLHARRGFEDAPDEGFKRHLWRIWINETEKPRPIHEDRKERRNRGLLLTDVPRQVPIDILEPVI